MNLISRIAATGALALPLVAGVSTAAHAESAPGCSSTVQIGSTATIVSGGQTFASVKQFKGCGKNWAYLYVWQSWRNNHGYTDACVSVANLDTTPYQLMDLNCLGPGQIEVWSYGANTLNNCTWAVGWISDGPSAHTDERC